MYREQDVRRLGLAVCGPLVVAGVEPRVVPTDAGVAVSGRGDGDDPAAARGDGRPQAVDQCVVAEVVGGELGLPAGAEKGALGQGHDPRVPDEDVDCASGGEEPLGEGPHTVLVAEVEGV